MSMKFYRNIRTGETGYIDVKEPVHYDTNPVGCSKGYSCRYKFSNFVLHTVIAGVTGLIAASIVDSTVLGIIIGIISFVISTVIHLAKEDDLFNSCARKSSIIKQMITYIISIGTAIGITAIANAIFGMGIAAIVAIIAIIAVILIIKYADRYQA